jgi:uncharacterized protein (DUF433 family)
MAQVEQPYVLETPGVCGGYPRVANTRIPVRVIVEFTRMGVDIDGLLAMYPQLTAEQIRGALHYYEQHPGRVDEDIATNALALAELQRQSRQRQCSA